MSRVSEDAVVSHLLEQGLTIDEARASVGQVRVDPLFELAAALADQVHRTDGLLMVSHELSKLSPEPATLEWRPTLPREAFLTDFYARNRPVLMEGVAADWPAGRWTPDLLRTRCGDVEVEVMAERQSDPNYELNSNEHRTRMSFPTFIDLIQNTGGSNDTYLVANNHFFDAPATRHLLDDMSPLPDFLEPESLKGQCHMWLGPAGTTTPLHYDVVNILFVQLYGRKRFFLASPAQHALMYNRTGVFSDVDLDALDFERYPAFAGVEAFTFILEPGDALFIPVSWWHQVRSLDASISVSMSNFRAPNSYPFLSSP